MKVNIIDNGFMIEFIKVVTKNKVLESKTKKNFNEKLEEINAIYDKKIIDILDDNMYKVYCESLNRAKTELEMDTMRKLRDRYYTDKVKKTEEERKKKIKELIEKVYGKQIKINMVDGLDSNYDIKIVYGFTADELKQKREDLINSLVASEIETVSYCPYLVLKVYRLKDMETYKEHLKLEIYYKTGEKEQYNGTIYSAMSVLDKKLPELVDYGTELGRQELAEIRKIIKIKYSQIPIIEADNRDELKVSDLYKYIKENEIKETTINAGKTNEKRLYLIPSEKFDHDLKKYKNVTETIDTLIKDGVVVANKGRIKYKYNNKYYIAVNAEKMKISEITDKEKNNG